MRPLRLMLPLMVQSVGSGAAAALWAVTRLPRRQSQGRSKSPCQTPMRRARGAVLFEGRATRDDSLPPAKDFPGYLDKYAREIERLGWTPESFSSDYSAGIRITVTRTRAWRLDALAPR